MSITRTCLHVAILGFALPACGVQIEPKWPVIALEEGGPLASGFCSDRCGGRRTVRGHGALRATQHRTSPRSGEWRGSQALCCEAGSGLAFVFGRSLRSVAEAEAGRSQGLRDGTMEQSSGASRTGGERPRHAPPVAGAVRREPECRCCVLNQTVGMGLAGWMAPGRVED